MLAGSLTTDRLRSPELWDQLLAEGADGRGRWRRRKLAAYRQLVADGEVGRRVEAYATGRLSLDPPTRRLLNKADGRKKVVFTFAPADELLLKALNRILQATTAADHSRLCHSFQPGRGPRTAYRDIRRIRGLQRLHCLHLDVRDFFNSIPVEQMLASLPDTIAGDEPLRRLLESTLRDSRVISGGQEAIDPHKGVMAGTPLAPLLSNLYLRPLDEFFEVARAPYLRYADDIVVFGNEQEIDHRRRSIQQCLLDLGLELNARKTRLSPPGRPWEFLGLKYDRGYLDLATNSAAKVRRRARRIARRARGRPDPALAAVRRLNRRLFGVGGRPSDFTWASWFFPLLSGDATLRRLDGLIQEQLRFAVTGVHSRRNLKEVPYERLQGAGYLPLVTAYHAYHRGPDEYEALLESCTDRLQQGNTGVAS
ncbi:MAG: reverse transcriptase/maturase family protein [Candidatus Dormibacteraeota bacterium]|nr:reverse transcriptase/maturase family protein [Candidatus Dormibacteraeota bacterium]